MKKLIALVALISILTLAGCAQGQTSSSAHSSTVSVSTTENHSASESTSAAIISSASESANAAATRNATETSTSFLIDVNGVQLMAKPANTEAARTLMEQLQAGPVTVNLHAYGGFEQVGPLPWNLPESNEQITTSPGDIMLYQGDQITIFTGSNSWAYTPLGSIEGTTSELLLEAFGGNAVDITLSLI